MKQEAKKSGRLQHTKGSARERLVMDDIDDDGYRRHCAAVVIGTVTLIPFLF